MRFTRQKPPPGEPVKITRKVVWYVDEKNQTRMVDNYDEALTHFYYYKALIFKFGDTGPVTYIPEHRVLREDVYHDRYYSNSLRGD